MAYDYDLIKARKEAAERFAEATEKLKKYNLTLPELTGSDKQVKWAKEIRVTLIADIIEEQADLNDFLNKVNQITSAEWWIDKRNIVTDALYESIVKRCEYQEQVEIEKQWDIEDIAAGILVPHRVKYREYKEMINPLAVPNSYDAATKTIEVYVIARGKDRNHREFKNPF